MLPNVQGHYRKVTKETPKNLEIFVIPAFFEPASAALLLLETAVIVPAWEMIQLVVYLTLLAKVLQLTEQFNQ